MTDKLLSLRKELYYFALSLTKNREDAEDLVQDTILRALIYKDRYVDTRFKSWVFAIMKNIFLNHKLKKRYDTPIDGVMIGRATDPTLYTDLRYALGTLKAGHKTAFVMHVYGYSYNDINSACGLEKGAIKARIYLARKQMKEILNDYR